MFLMIEIPCKDEKLSVVKATSTFIRYDGVKKEPCKDLKIPARLMTKPEMMLTTSLAQIFGMGIHAIGFRHTMS